MLIKVGHTFQPYMNGLSEIEVECKTVSEGIAKWLNKFPQLQVRLLDNQAELGFKSYAILDGEYISEIEEINKEASADTVMTLVSELPSGSADIINYIIAVVIIIVAVILQQYELISTATMLISCAGAVMSAVLTAAGVLGNMPKAPAMANSSLDGSATYTFSGIRNTTASGTPTQIVYGEHRVGGHVLNMYTIATSEGSGDSETLYAQIGLCEGEIDSAMGLEVDKNPHTFYNALEFDVSRKGSSDQAVMTWFDRVENTTTVNLDIVNMYDSSNAVADLSSSSYDSLYSTYNEESASPVYGVVTNGTILFGPYKISR